MYKTSVIIERGSTVKDSFLSRMGNHIILDQIESWPYEILQIIIKNEDIIRNYLELEDLIDKQAEEDVLLRVYRPQNKYKLKWRSIINQLEDKLKLCMFVGFHCTKLTDDEIHDITCNGLKPLSSEFLNFRIDQLRNNRIIDDKVAIELKNNNLSSQSNREGNVFFFHGSKTLKDEFGLYRLFRSWGGEALYATHESNIEIFSELFRIGKPCIVLGSLSYNEMNPYPSLACKFITVYLNKTNLAYNGYDFDNWVKKSVKVISVITIDEKLFEYLTEYSTWKLDR